MSTVTNPLSGLIEGLLQGHAIATQLHRQQLEDQAFKTNQMLHMQNLTTQEIMNKQWDEMHSRPIQNGTVENPAVQGAEMQSPVPGLPNETGPGMGAYVRKADPSRSYKRTDHLGNQINRELFTPEEQQTRDVDQQVKVAKTLEQAKYEQQAREQQETRANTLKLEGGGIPATGLQSVGVQDGALMTRSEFTAMTEAAQKIKNANLHKLTPGETLVDTSDAPGAATPGTLGASGPVMPELSGAPSDSATAATPGAKPASPGPRVVATGGAAAPTGEFGAYLRAAAMKAGYTVANAPPDLVMKATTDYAQKAKTPEDMAQVRAMHDLTMQLTQAHIDDLKSRQTTKSQPIEPGTREFRVAQDLAYGKLTMQQFRSLTAYSRDTNKKMDIYDKAAELNPNFNPAQFEMGFKFAANPKSQQQLASMDNVMKGIDDLLKFSDAASRTGITVLNKFVNKGGFMVGGKKYSDFHTAQIAFADELSGALGFGGATDMSRQMGIDITNPNLSPENFRSTVENVVKPFIERKRKSMLDQMGVYGEPGMNPAAGTATPAAPAAGASGHTIAINGKNYIYKGAGATDDIKNYTEVKK